MPLAMTVRKRLPHFTLEAELRCEPGTLTALVGPSGAGKTTLMRIAAGLERPDEGRVALGSTVWVDTRAGVFVPPRQRGLGFVFQDYPLFPHLTVRANVAIAARRKERVDELLTLFGIARLAGKRPGAISGGERQRAAFCQALARDPVLLLLDEPFSALDAATRRALRTELAGLKATLGVPILHVTHDLGEARELGDAIVAVEEGRLCPEWLERNAGGAAAACRGAAPDPGRGTPSPCTPCKGATPP
ncbi:ATP-binding cassette domain-containing protein [Desulfocurvus vexinensis]|uniref:ATP-binding cassette domain-containing protein n=1 Tax=Desulfocurvus vexinensis TaxID=399548 RepID=UPI0004B9F9D2|nr:ATP-binding cassette domain-containing protein [Desulfocurvus vexinensis]